MYFNSIWNELFFLILTEASFLFKPLTNGATDHNQVITTLHGSIEVYRMYYPLLS